MTLFEHGDWTRWHSKRRLRAGNFKSGCSCWRCGSSTAAKEMSDPNQANTQSRRQQKVHKHLQISTFSLMFKNFSKYSSHSCWSQQWNIKTQILFPTSGRHTGLPFLTAHWLLKPLHQDKIPEKNWRQENSQGQWEFSVVKLLLFNTCSKQFQREEKHTWILEGKITPFNSDSSWTIIIIIIN